MIRTGDPVDVRLAKQLQHVVREERWPAGTIFDEYVASLVDVVRSDESGIFADRRSTHWVLTFVGRSGIWQGLGGPRRIRKIDVRLRSLGGRIEALAQHGARFGPHAGDDRGPDWYALAAEWRDALDRLEWLHELFEHGEMSQDQATQHRQNLLLLRRNIAVLRHRGLVLASGAIAAWLAAASEVAALA